jgi:hypothetical protein
LWVALLVLLLEVVAVCSLATPVPLVPSLPLVSSVPLVHSITIIMPLVVASFLSNEKLKSSQSFIQSSATHAQCVHKILEFFSN